MKKIIVIGIIVLVLSLIFYNYKYKSKTSMSESENLPKGEEEGTIRVDNIDVPNKKLNYSVYLEGGWIPNSKLFTDTETDNYDILGRKITVVSDGTTITINTGSFWKDININGTINPK